MTARACPDKVQGTTRAAFPRPPGDGTFRERPACIGSGSCFAAHRLPRHGAEGEAKPVQFGTEFHVTPNRTPPSHPHRSAISRFREITGICGSETGKVRFLPCQSITADRPNHRPDADRTTRKDLGIAALQPSEPQVKKENSGQPLRVCNPRGHGYFGKSPDHDSVFNLSGLGCFDTAKDVGEKKVPHRERLLVSRKGLNGWHFRLRTASRR